MELPKTESDRASPRRPDAAHTGRLPRGPPKSRIAFRDLIKKMNVSRLNDLPAGSFSSVGTNVNTVVLKVYKDGRSFY